MKRPCLRLLSGALCLCLLLSLGGCRQEERRDVILYRPDAREPDPILLQFFGFKADALNLTAIEAALQGFMAENDGVTVTYEGIKGATYYDALLLRASTGNLDDLFMVDHDRGLLLARQGKLADLSQVPGVENFTLQARAQISDVDGSIHFLPTCISTYGLYVNYDLLKAHHQELPANWEQFRQVCDYFVSQGITPIIANNYTSLPSLMAARGLFRLYQRPDSAAAVRAYNNHPADLADELVPGIEMAAEMLERGWLDPEEVLATQQTSDDLALFVQGERPFMVTGGWAAVRVDAMGPDFSYRVHPYPILDDGSVLSSQLDTCIAVNADSPWPAQARDLVSYLIRPDVIWAYCDSQSSYAPLKEEFASLTSRPSTPMAEYLANGRSIVLSDYRLELPLNTALASCAQVLLKGGTPAQAHAALTAALSQ